MRPLGTRRMEGQGSRSVSSATKSSPATATATALRELARHDPSAVAGFVDRHSTDIARVSVVEHADDRRQKQATAKPTLLVAGWLTRERPSEISGGRVR